MMPARVRPRRRVLPGFGPTLGVPLLYLSSIHLITLEPLI